jgi:hypothetical protein
MSSLRQPLNPEIHDFFDFFRGQLLVPSDNSLAGKTFENQGYQQNREATAVRWMAVQPAFLPLF